jgi:hypothetical protein
MSQPGRATGQECIRPRDVLRPIAFVVVHPAAILFAHDNADAGRGIRRRDFWVDDWFKNVAEVWKWI